MDLKVLLKKMLTVEASDLHLKVGATPIMRVFGELQPIGERSLTREDMESVLGELLTPDQQKAFRKDRELDCAIGVRQLGRFRVNVGLQRGTPCITLRAVPVSIKTIESLNLPPVVGELAELQRGLVLITGITGSGKTTTLASMIDHINARRKVKIVTIEDPIEFLFRDNVAFVTQREVGFDTHDFHAALRHVLRQDPDIIMVGEIRDSETMETAIKAANTGHLVLSTLHTTDAVQTIQRILTFFPVHQHDEILALLAACLAGIVSMRLLPAADGASRVPACEVMVQTEAIRDYLREGDGLREIPELIAEGGVQYGMQTFDQSLMSLYEAGKITQEAALDYATNPSEFSLRLSGVEAASDRAWEGS